MLAIGLGLLAGATYLSLDDGNSPVPLRAAGVLSLIAIAAAIGVAGLTVIAASPKLIPEHIRAE